MGLEFPATPVNPQCFRLAFLRLQLGQKRSSGGGPNKEEGLLFTESKVICQNQEVESQKLQDVSPVAHVSFMAHFLEGP